MFLNNRLSVFLFKPATQLGLVFIISLVVFAILQYNYILSDPDSFYHTRLTVLLRDGGVWRDFPWMQNSLYKHIFIDHHFGYHLLLIPFISIWPPLSGIKIATVFFAALTVLAAAWCLFKWRVPWWGLGVLLLLTAGPFLFRLSLAKAPSLGVGVAIVGYYLATRRQLGWLGWWSWFYTWLYSAWPLLAVMAVIYITVEASHKLSSGWRAAGRQLFSIINLKLIGVILAGYFVGLIINPYFPTNLLYLQQLFVMALTAYHKFLGIGAEWYPYNPFELVANIALPLGAWLLLSVAALFNFNKQTILTKSTWVLALFFLFYTFRARRQVEYLVPWLVLSSGLLLRDIWPILRRPDIKAELFNWLPQPLQGSLFRWFIIIYLAAAIPLGLGQGVKTAYSALRSGYSMDRLANVSQWLKNNSPPRSIIFQSDWSSFPILWYYNQHNYYLTGLDQTFMYKHNPADYRLWVAATRGERRDIYKIARDNFNADYVLLDKNYPAMLLWLNRDKRFNKIYEDKEVVVFKL